MLGQMAAQFCAGTNWRRCQLKRGTLEKHGCAACSKFQRPDSLVARPWQCLLQVLQSTFLVTCSWSAQPASPSHVKARTRNPQRKRSSWSTRLPEVYYSFHQSVSQLCSRHKNRYATLHHLWVSQNPCEKVATAFGRFASCFPLQSH